MLHKKKYFKIAIICIVFFCLGFFIHALFFPYLLADTHYFFPKKETQELPTENTEQSKALTQVMYKDGEFNPPIVQIKKSYYLSIVNTSEKELMWLISDNHLLSTPRGYGLSEEMRTILYEEGVWEVSDKLHPENKLVVIVK